MIIRPNQHYWALLNNQLCIVYSDKDMRFSIAGPWEGEIKFKELTFISEIDKPVEHSSKQFYYDI